MHRKEPVGEVSTVRGHKNVERVKKLDLRLYTHSFRRRDGLDWYRGKSENYGMSKE